MEDRKEQEAQPPYANLFGRDIGAIPPSERKRIADEYIARFTNRKVDDELLRQAGVNQKTTDPRHYEMLKLFGGDIILTELATRMNFCEYPRQIGDEEHPLPFTDLSEFFCATRKAFEKAISYSGETRVFVPNRFKDDNSAYEIRRVTDEDRQGLLEAQQKFNQAGSLLGLKHSMPNPNLGAVLVFKPGK